MSASQLRPLNEWIDLLREYYDTLPWYTKLRLELTCFFPVLNVSWEGFRKWLDEREQ